jgi:cytochrome P450
MELRVAVEEWVKRYPDFELADVDGEPANVTWAAGQVRGPRSIPVRINA